MRPRGEIGGDAEVYSKVARIQRLAARNHSADRVRLARAGRAARVRTRAPGGAHIAMVVTSSEADGPARLAKHTILVELGRGGMADVYLAVARGPADFHKLVVLKRLRADLAQDPSFREMALSEAKIAARLNHPNVVQTYEILTERERPVILREY